VENKEQQGLDLDARSARIRLFPLALLLLMVLSTILVAWRVQQFELEIARDRGGRQAEQLVGELERAFGFGMSVRDLSFLDGMLRKKLDEDGDLVSAWVSDENGETVARAGRSNAETGFKAAWNHRLAGKGRSSVFSSPPFDFVGMAAFDTLGQPAAKLWLVHDRSKIFQRGESTGAAIDALGCVGDPGGSLAVHRLASLVPGGCPR